MKKINEKMAKKIAVIVLAVAATFSVVGCSVEKTVTTTESHTDADGNTTTTTTTKTTDNNGTTTTTETTESGTEEAAEEEAELLVASLAFENQTDFDFAELYFSLDGSDDWGEELLGSDAPLAVGEVITLYDALTYSPDGSVWDIKAVDAEGNSVEFDGADVTVTSNPEEVYILFTYDEENQAYSAEIQ